MMSFITKYICPRKHIKICDLDYVYTLDQFKYFIKTNPVQLYEQMINEDKGFKIFISEYDETEPIILLNYPNTKSYISCNHLALVIEIHFEIQKINNKIIIDGLESDKPTTINTFDNSKIVQKKISFNTEHTDLTEWSKFQCKYFWIYKKNDTIFTNIYKHKISEFDFKICYNSMSLEESLPKIFNRAIIQIEQMDKNFDAHNHRDTIQILYGNRNKCSWKFNKKLNEKYNLINPNEDSELTNLLHKLD
jgi:hypothetical protein